MSRLNQILSKNNLGNPVKCDDWSDVARAWLAEYLMLYANWQMRKLAFISN